MPFLSKTSIIHSVQRYRSTRDGNGNSRSCYVLRDERGDIVSVRDAYAGRSADLRGLADMGDVSVTLSEYRETVAMGARLASKVEA